MATRPKAVIESRNGEKFSPITITKNVLTDDGQNLHDILSDRKEDMMTPTIENSSSMFKVGQGDNVDYSSNVVNGAYESLVFKGKSLVNLLTKTIDTTWNLNLENWSIVSTASSDYVLKPSTTYSVIVYVTEKTCRDREDLFWVGDVDGKKDKVTHDIVRKNVSLGANVFVINTVSDFSSVTSEHRGGIYFQGSKFVEGTLKWKAIVLEGDWTNKELPPYFEGICDCKSPILTNVGKNLFNFSDSTMKSSWWITVENGITNVKKEDLSTNYSVIIPAQSNTKYKVSGNNFTRAFYAFLDKDYNVLHADEMVQRTTKSLSPQGTAYALFYLNHEDIEKVTNLQIEEGSTETSYEPYKSNILSANGDKIELTEDMFEQGHCGYNSSVIGSTYENFKNSSSTSMQANRVRSKALIKIKPNTKYFIKTDSTKFKLGVQGFDANKLSMGYDTNWKTSDIFTTPANMHYAGLHVCKNNNEDLTPTDLDFNFIQLSEVDKTIALRSLPSGVCDTLNVETGEYTQRIGEVVLNGSEKWEVSGVVSKRYSLEAPINSIVNTTKILCICDKFPSITTNQSDYDKLLGITITNGTRIMVNTNYDTIDEFKQYLQQNLATVQYELKEPIVSTVDIQGFPYAYTNGHVQLSSGSIGQSLTPKVEYSVVTNRNGQIRSNQKMVERHQKQLDRLQAMILTNLVNTQYEQTLTNLKYDLKNVREEVK